MRGNLLAGGDGDTEPAQRARRSRTKIVRRSEERQRGRIEALVSSVVGIGHVRVQVTAEMKFDHTSTTSEDLRPRNRRVVRSTQTVERAASDTSGGSDRRLGGQCPPGGGQNGGGGNERSNSNATARNH